MKMCGFAGTSNVTFGDLVAKRQVASVSNRAIAEGVHSRDAAIGSVSADLVRSKADGDNAIKMLMDGDAAYVHRSQP